MYHEVTGVFCLQCDSACADFRQVVTALLGHYHALGDPGYESAVDLLNKLDLFSTKLTTKYHALLKPEK